MKYKNSQPNRVLIKRFWPYLMRYKGILFFDLFCAALTTLCELVLPLLMRTVTNVGLSDMQQLTLSFIARIGILYFVLRIIDGFANYFMAKQGHIMGAHIETDMRRDAFSHLQQLSTNYFANTKVGHIMGRITNDLFDVTEFSHHCPEEFFIAALKGTAAFLILASVNFWLTFIIFAFIPPMIICCTKLNLYVRANFRRQRDHIGELNARLEDTLLGTRVVKAFSGEELEKEKFEKDNEFFLDIKKDTYHWAAAFHTTSRLFDGLMYLVVLVVGALFMKYGKISPGDLVAYMLYITTLLGTIRRIVEFSEQFQRGMTGIERFFEMMDSDIEIFDEPDAKPIEHVSGEIVFDHVSFHYSDSETNVLDKLCLKITPGEKVALVGPSGGGKTTLTNLIPRFYDPTEGNIFIDGQNIKQVTLKSLRSAIGIVQQDVYLFSGTIFENIAYGKPDATQEDVERAAKLAGAHEFILKLKDGYHTYVGERGIKLSGGQKQRISIARVFLKNPPILVMDEATSALDNESELIVNESLTRLAQGRTTLTIAHRLTTIQNADRILVLGENGIEEEGTHEELLKQNGIYNRLWNGAKKLECDVI